MTEQEIQAAAAYVLKSAHQHCDCNCKCLLNGLLDAGHTVAQTYLAMTNPPTLNAADAAGWWWIKSKEGEPWIVSVNRDESGFFHEINGYRFPATGGLWQRVIGPFGMEGKT